MDAGVAFDGRQLCAPRRSFASEATPISTLILLRRGYDACWEIGAGRDGDS